MKQQHIRAAVCSHMGCLRTNNEDNYFLNGLYMPLENMDAGGIVCSTSTERCQLYAVCDGMGGESDGELASFIAVSDLEDLRDGLKQDNASVRELIGKAVNAININICKIKGERGAGSTISIVCLQDGLATTAYLGDSRIYMLRKRTLYRLSQDHTQTQRLMNLGILTVQDAQAHPAKHVLTMYLGMKVGENTVAPSFGKTQRLRKGDTYLICSDGLTDLVDEEKIAELLGLDVELAARSLVSSALSAGGKDNVTALVIRYFI